MFEKLKRNLRYDLPLHFVLLITNWLPDNIIFIRLRGFLAKPFFKSCGSKLGIGRNVVFYNPSKMNFGNNIYIAYGCWFSGSITVEDEVLFGPYCILAPTDHQKSGQSFRFGGNTKGSILVKKGSWLGAQSLIVGNSSLGAGSILSANSVLNVHSDDHSVYGGSPAEKIKKI